MARMTDEPSPEILAIGTVYAALKVLEPQAQLRVLRYSAEMLGLRLEPSTREPPEADSIGVNSERASIVESVTSPASIDHTIDAEGINAVALKWIKRAGLDAASLQPFFSLGIDEIDLVAKSVPGSGKKERMRSVLLLKGIAAYLGTGTPRVTHEQLKEACLHYDAYDGTNFAKHLKSFVSEAAGTKGSGFTLTARGLTSATELLKEMMNTKSK